MADKPPTTMPPASEPFPGKKKKMSVTNAHNHQRSLVNRERKRAAAAQKVEIQCQ